MVKNWPTSIGYVLYNYVCKVRKYVIFMALEGTGTHLSRIGFILRRSSSILRRRCRTNSWQRWLIMISHPTANNLVNTKRLQERMVDSYVTLQQKPTCVVHHFITWRPSNDLSFLVGDLCTKNDIKP